MQTISKAIKAFLFYDALKGNRVKQIFQNYKKRNPTVLPGTQRKEGGLTLAKLKLREI